MKLDPDVAIDYSMALVGGGLPSTIHLASALAEGDMDEAFYYLKLELAVLGTQYAMLRYLNWLSPKNAISFRTLHHGLSFGRGQLMTAAAPLAIGGAAFYGTLKGIEYGIDRTFGESFRKSVRTDPRGGQEKSLFYFG